MFTNKKFIIGIMAFMVLVLSYFFVSSNFETNKSISMALFKVENKHDYTKPGAYTEMWIIGYNADEEEGNRERYKIFIEDAMVYNLIKEGEAYLISASSFRKDKDYVYAYELNQISNQVEYQITGKGRIK